MIEDLFHAQLQGKARNPELRLKLLRKLSGIKEPPKKKLDEKERKKLGDKSKKKLVARQPGAAPPPSGAPVRSQKAADTLARLQAARKSKAAAPAPPPAKAAKPKATATRKR